ncbi:MAG: zinc metallopeptidase [Clostridia bacterium]|nr:zinc metallopeptidase [Clostridia bacterium]
MNYNADMILYFALILALIFSIWAQLKVKTTFSKYSAVSTRAGRTAAEVAEMILKSEGVFGVRVERVRGSLTDHFDPRTNTLRLSESVYSSTTAAAVGVAAHEAGHAIQHARGYFPIKVRSAMVPAVSFASKFCWIIIIAGILTMSLLESSIGYYVMLFGIGLFAVATLFELVTLPCEFDASKRAMHALGTSGWYSREELRGSRAVLTSAALTYVAALAVSALQLIRLVLRYLGNGRRR